MSLLKRYLSGFQFRSTHPTLSPGDVVEVFLSEHTGEEGIARIGDTTLVVTDVPPEHEGKQVRVQVDRFDADDSTGRGTFQAVVGESSYTD